MAGIEAAVRLDRGADDVLGLVVRAAAEVVGVAAAVALTAGTDGHFLVRATTGAPLSGLAGTRVIHPDVLRAQGLRGVLYARIPGGGLLGVGHPRRRRFGSEQRHIVELFAGLAAGALRNEPVAQLLARELHDSLAQSLYGISLRVRAAQELLDRDPAGAGAPLSQVMEIAATGLAETRGLISDLRPDTLAGDGLAVALARLLDTLHTGYGTATWAHLSAEVPAELAARQALYRIAQEALHNAGRHAGAGQVGIRLYHEDGRTVLEVEDDGCGFDPAQRFPGRLGLRSMRERAEAAGGRLVIVTAPARGTVVRAVLPVSPPAAR